jgi:hypothetical protein
MKRISSLFLLLPLISQIVSAEPTSLPPLDLYLLIGQSNMAGRGEIEKIDQTPHPRVYALGPEDIWKVAVEPLHFDIKNRGTGPGLALGKTLADAKPDATIGLIPSAVGGTIIDHWFPGHERGLYEEALRRTRTAMKHGELRAIIWQQGESDSTVARAPLYKEKLVALMTRLRKDLGQPDLPIILGGLGDFLLRESYLQVNEGIEQAAREMSNTLFIPASKKGHIGDNLHFNAAAQRENGANQAIALLRLEEKEIKIKKSEKRACTGG